MHASRPLKMDKAAAKNPLPPKLAALIRESWWLAMVALAMYLLLVLYSYDRVDPAWSHGIDHGQFHNAGGKVGAWIADVLLYVFGMSAYWWVVFCLSVIL